jgi:phosphoglycolate phosphatase
VTGGPALALFDLDGTLIDSVPDIADAVDAALVQCGHSAIGEELVRAYIGEGAGRLVHRALTGRLDGVAKEAEFNCVKTSFFAIYRRNLFARSNLYPHVRSTLDALMNAGCALAVVTNKPQQFAEPLLKLAGLEAYFSVVVGGDLLAHKKPHAAPLVHVTDTLQIEPTQAVMIGDSVIDLGAASNAGMPSVAVTYGYGDNSALDKFGADAIIDTLEDLPGALQQLF